MGSKKISQLPALTAISGTEELPLHKSGVTIKTTVNAIKNLITKESIGLANVDNTSDLNKPISTATLNALNMKSDTVHSHSIGQVINLQQSLDNKSNVGHNHTVDNIANLQPLLDGKASIVHNHSMGDITGLQAALDSKLEAADFSNKANIIHTHNIVDILNLSPILDNKSNISHTHTKADVGLDQVDNVADINKGISNITKNYIDTAIANIVIPSGTSDINVRALDSLNEESPSLEPAGIIALNASGIAALVSNGVAALTSEHIVALTLNDLKLDQVENTTDLDKPLSVPQKTYIDNAIAVVVATGGSVASVNTKTGIVVLDASDIGLGSVNNTSDLDKPVSTATQSSLDGKSDLGHIHQLNDIVGLQGVLDVKSDLGHTHAATDITGLDNYAICGEIEW